MSTRAQRRTTKRITVAVGESFQQISRVQGVDLIFIPVTQHRFRAGEFRRFVDADHLDRHRFGERCTFAVGDRERQGRVSKAVLGGDKLEPFNLLKAVGLAFDSRRVIGQLHNTDAVIG